MTTTTPSAPDEVVLDKRGLHEALEAHLRLFPHMLKNDGIHAIHDIISTYLRNAPGLFRWGDDDEVLPVASPQPAGVTAHGLHDDSEPVHAGLCRMMDDGGLPDDYRRIAAAAYARIPSPTDTRERVLALSDETIRYIAESKDVASCRQRIIRALKSKPTEAPVEDGWVRVPREEFGRLLATAHELTAYHIVTPETPDNELVHVCNGDLRKLDERVTAFALAASTKEE